MIIGSKELGRHLVRAHPSLNPQEVILATNCSYPQIDAEAITSMPRGGGKEQEVIIIYIQTDYKDERGNISFKELLTYIKSQGYLLSDPYSTAKLEENNPNWIFYLPYCSYWQIKEEIWGCISFYYLAGFQGWYTPKRRRGVSVQQKTEHWCGFAVAVVRVEEDKKS